MARNCPVCEARERKKIFSMDYQVPDNWPLPDRISWYTCNRCQMIYGDGNFDQAMLDQYYRERYGYGVNNPANTERLVMDAVAIDTLTNFNRSALVIDFGGSGDDGKSVLVDKLQGRGYKNSICVHPGDKIPANCNVIYASHVLEHIYDLPKTMKRLTEALAPDGLLIVDVPNSTGLLQHWKKPILDFNTKHLNHFTLRNLLDLGFYHGLEMVYLKQYELEVAPCVQVHFKRLSVAIESRDHIYAAIADRILKLEDIKQPVNVWGMSDIVWYLLSMVELDVLNYIDNDPAMRGQTFKGKPILERPDNDNPIVIMAQGQRERLIANIRATGITSEIIEI